ncbi:MAG: hypothetical protein WCX61_02185 [Candidatus Peribacteraceae bacterium]
MRYRFLIPRDGTEEVEDHAGRVLAVQKALQPVVSQGVLGSEKEHGGTALNYHVPAALAAAIDALVEDIRTLVPDIQLETSPID